MIKEAVVGSAEEIAKVINKILKKRFVLPVRVVMLSGHGASNTVVLDDGKTENILMAFNEKWLKSLSKIDPKAIVIFNTCSAGKKDENFRGHCIAEDTAKLSKKTIFASKCNVAGVIQIINTARLVLERTDQDSDLYISAKFMAGNQDMTAVYAQ